VFATREHPAGAFGAVGFDSVLLQRPNIEIEWETGQSNVRFANNVCRGDFELDDYSRQANTGLLSLNDERRA